MAPFDRKDGGVEKWLNRRVPEEVAERQLSILQRNCPNVTRDKVLWAYLTTPADIPNRFANMVKVSYKQGASHPLQMGYLRPNQYCSQYGTAIKKLHLGGKCGSRMNGRLWAGL